MNETRTRMLDSLPAIYRASDSTGHLRQLLAVFEEVLFYSNDTQELPGIEQQIDATPSFFSPLGDENTRQLSYIETPDRFLPWLATWVAFTPHALFKPGRLRTIISGIAPLYGKRGTRVYLEQLLKLCFEEISEVEIDDEPVEGFLVGRAKVGIDTLFGDERPFWFRVDITVNRQNSGSEATESNDEFERCVRAIIDFAKPGHTAYELHVYFSSLEEGRYTV
jgi:phage tail-like protein